MTDPRLSQCYCGKCNTHYNVLNHGCDACLPAKAELVIPRTDEEGFEGTELGAMVQQQLRLLKLSTDRLENEMHGGVHPKDRKSTDKRKWRFDPGHHKLAMLTAKAGATLLSEARKFEKQQADGVDNLTTDERRALIAEMIRQLPDPDKRQLEQSIVKMLAPPEDAEVVK